jgi:Replication initiator protein, pSAM2
MVYLTKSIGQAAGLDEHASDAHRDHAHRLHAELRVTPCSPRCPVWLLYGIQPHGARHSMTPGRCKGKAHKPEHLGIAGRRILVSRKWSNKTLDVPLCSTFTRIAQRCRAEMAPWWSLPVSRTLVGGWVSRRVHGLKSERRAGK